MKLYLPIVILLTICCAHLESNITRRTDSTVDDERAAEIYESGNNFFKQKNYTDALKEFEIIIEKAQGSEAYEPALYLAAFSSFKLNDFANAARLTERFIGKFPNSQFFLNATSLLGESYYKMAEDYNAAYYLVRFYTLSEESEARKAAFERIIKILPELSIAQLEKLHRAYMAEPIDEHILFNLAQIEAREGKKKEAERDFNLLIRRFPATTYTLEVEEYKRFIGLGETTRKVGILLPLTGSYASYGQSLLEVVKIFEKSADLPFTMHYLDTKSDPIEAVLAAARLIEDYHVDFLIAPIRLYEAFSVCGVAYGKGIPLILPLTAESRFESIPFIFTTAPNNEEQARILAEYSIYELGIQKFAILYPDVLRFESIARSFAEVVRKNHREVVASISFPSDSITLKTEIESIKDKEPEAVFLAMDTDMIINTAPQLAYYGLEEIKILGVETFHDEKVTRLGEKYVDGAIFVTSQSIDSLTMKKIKKEGFGSNDFTSRFYSVLWKLQNLEDYDRANLFDRLSKILKDKKIFDVYRINGYEFVKLTEISK
jgi:ABC-type branched-subunit amino acid transport system substrate-binding protein